MPQHAESQKQVIGGVPSNAELDALVMRLNEQADVDEIEGEPEDFKWAETQRKAASAIVALRQDENILTQRSLDLAERNSTLWARAETDRQRAWAAERDAARWKDYATHQETCATCGESVSDCDTGSALRDAAMKAKP